MAYLCKNMAEFGSFGNDFGSNGNYFDKCFVGFGNNFVNECLQTQFEMVGVFDKHAYFRKTLNFDSFESNILVDKFDYLRRNLNFAFFDDKVEILACYVSN